MDEEIRSSILKRVDEYGYKSAKFRLALIKEESFWKILACEIMLDISETKQEEPFLKEEYFILQDISVPISEFKKFIDYLGRVHIADISPSGEAKISKKVQFTIGNYDLYFVGNFPGNTLDFFGRKVARDHHGVDKPIYTAWYSIHQSVTVKKYPKLDLTGAGIPFRNVTDAINYFWKTNYEPHSLNQSCNIYMPIFEASISSCRVEDGGDQMPGSILLEFDIDPKRTKKEDLSCGIIAECKSKYFKGERDGMFVEEDIDADSFRDQFSIDKYNLVSVDLNFMPDSVNVYLNHKGKRIDEYNYYNYQANDYALMDSKQYITETPRLNEEKIQDSLLDPDLISKMPKHIQDLLNEAENAYQAGLYRSTLMLFRSALDEGIILILKKVGMEDKLYNDKNYEMRLGKKIQTYNLLEN